MEENEFLPVRKPLLPSYSGYNTSGIYKQQLPKEFVYILDTKH